MLFRQLVKEAITPVGSVGTSTQSGVKLPSAGQQTANQANLGPATQQAVDQARQALDKLPPNERAKAIAAASEEGVEETWDEGYREPPNNFAIYINGKKWKVFRGHGQYADDRREMTQLRQLQDWCAKKSAATGKKWEVFRTGEKATESVEEDAMGVGQITRQNTTQDVRPGEERRQMRKLGLADSQLAADNLMAIIESIKKGQTIIIDLDDDLPMEIDPVLAKLVYESVKNCDQEELVSRLVSYDYITDIQAQQLTEQLSIMTSDQKEAIPHTYVIPKLHNTDPYIQYRYGVALATAKGEKDRAHEGSANNVGQRSEWGEALAIIDYDGSQGHAIDLALKMVGLSSKDKVAITSKGSRETGDVHNQSPVAARKELKDLYK